MVRGIPPGASGGRAGESAIPPTNRLPRAAMMVRSQSARLSSLRRIGDYQPPSGGGLSGSASPGFRRCLPRDCGLLCHIRNDGTTHARGPSKIGRMVPACGGPARLIALTAVMEARHDPLRAPRRRQNRPDRCRHHATKLSFVYAGALYSPTPRLQLLHSLKPVPL
jgi:hypothetical protein